VERIEMPRLGLALLGPFEARRETGQVVAIRRRKAQALLAYLALRRGECQPRERLIALLWEDLDPSHARHSLRQTLTELRQDLGPASFAALVLDGDAIALDAARVSVDVLRFERLAASPSVDALPEAVGVYRGDLLEGAPGGGEAFESWLGAERERLRALLVQALDRLLGRQARAGPLLETVAIATRLLDLDPCREDVHRTLMRLYARAGRRSAALRQYRACVATLRRELGVAPEPETMRLHRAILEHRLADAQSGLPAVSEGSAPPLVGRGFEIHALSAALATAWDGAGHTVVIRGAAGIGKSRLVTELARRAAARGGRVLTAHAHESEQVLPFGLWASLLQAAGLIGEAEFLATLTPGDRRALAALVPGVEPGDRGRPPDPVAVTRLFGAIQTLLRRLAERGPIAVILEDLHWADEMSLRLFGYLVRRTCGTRILMVATVRDEDLAAHQVMPQILAEASREAVVEELALGPIRRDDALALARALLRGGKVADTPALVQRMWDLSQGNPFVLVESARALREGQSIAGSGPLPVPPSVRDLVIGRVQRLGERARRVLETAAVIGRAFEPSLAGEALGWTELEVAQHVDELLRRQFLQDRDACLEFGHERLREVVYASLSGPERRALHGRVAAALERRHAGDLGAVAMWLAVQCKGAHSWERTARYYGLAADAAVLRSAYASAEALLHEALAAAACIEDARRRTERVIDVHLGFERVLTPQGELGRLLDHLGRAETAAREVGDRRRLAWVAAQRIHCAWWSGDSEAALRTGEQAMEAAARLGDRELDIVIRLRLAPLYFHLGDLAHAIRVCDEALAALPGDSPLYSYGQAVPPAVHCRIYRALCRSALGATEAAERDAREAVQTAERCGHRFSIALARATLGSLELQWGRVEAARASLESAVELQRQMGDESRLLATFGALGLAYVRAGRLPEGVALIEQAAHASESQGLRYVHQRNLEFLARARLHEGRVAEALQWVEEALGLARAQKQRVAEARALLLLARVLMAGRDQAAGPRPRALDACRDALTLSQQLGVAPLVARCRETLAELLQAGCLDRRQQLTGPPIRG
jgi:DNA-binding SARP family transcriptional activator